MTERLDARALVPALEAGAWLTGVVVPPAEGLPRALNWLMARWAEGEEHLPFTLAHDLGHLLLYGRSARLASSAWLERWPAVEREGRLAYEDAAISRWLVDPSLAEAHLAVAGLPEEARDAAIVHALGLALGAPLERAAEDPEIEATLVAGNAAWLRQAIPGFLHGQHQDFGSWLTDGPPTPEWVEWARETLNAAVAALPQGRLFTDAELWEIAHLTELPSESTRMALRQVHAVAEAVGPVDPGMAVLVRRRAQETPVSDDAADEFPAGGFNAVSPRGRLENLVRSELGYSGETVKLGANGAEVDLFDLRFIQGELLYYTRDESPLLDARRTLILVFDRPATLRHKLPGLPAQDLVLAQGVALALYRDLTRPGMLGPEGVQLVWCWRAVDAEDLAAAEEEHSLMALSLAADVAHRRVSFETLYDLDDERLPRGVTVVFSPLAAPGALEPRQHWVRVGAPWRINGGEELAEVDLSEKSALREVVDVLLPRVI